MQQAMPMVAEWGADSDAGVTRLGHLTKLVQVEDHLVVSVNGVPIQHLDATDRTELLVTLVELSFAGAVCQQDVLDAGLFARATFQRCRGAYRQGGVAAVRDRCRMGPKQPSKTKPPMQRRIVRLGVKGRGPAAIARLVGVSERTVRRVLEAQGIEWKRHGEPQEKLATSVGAASAAEGVPEARETRDEADGDGQQQEPPSVGVERGSGVPGGLPTGLPPQGVSVDAVRAEEMLFGRMGWIEEQSVLFESGRGVAFAGVLLALAVLPATGLLKAARRVVGQLHNGLYGLRSLLTMLFVMGMLRIKRPEQLKAFCPSELGRVLGLARAPEMKTLRRKVGLAAHNEEVIAGLLREIGREHVRKAGDAIAFLYIDGHVRPYFGKHKLSKTHVTQMRISMPATTDYWVNDANGAPVLVVTVEGNRKMTRHMREILTDVRALVGPKARPTVVFDRGGFSAEVFRTLRDLDFDFITYRKGKAPKYPHGQFSELKVCQGRREVSRPVRDAYTRVKGYGRLRCVAILRSDGNQTHILTSHDRESLGTREVCDRMSARWTQENFLKYLSEQYALDALWTYDVVNGDPQRLVPNPERKRLDRSIRTLRAELRKADQRLGSAFAAADETTPENLTNATIDDITLRDTLAAQLAEQTAQRKGMPTHVPVGTVTRSEDLVELARGPKLLTDAAKICAYNAETMLVSALAPHLGRAEDEARSIVTAAMQLPGDLDVQGDELHVTLAPMSAPRYTQALQGLVAAINDIQPTFPETSLRLRFHVAHEQAHA